MIELHRAVKALGQTHEIVCGGFMASEREWCNSRAKELVSTEVR
ncbi:MAG: hypothetical protein WBY44_28500 [Bryobacteraceae bacterium]